VPYKPVVGVPGPPGSTAVDDDDSGALGTHSVTSTPPLTGGGTLVTNPVLGITQATGGTNGFLTAVDFLIFLAKMSNPMTALGDLIYGGAGAPAAPTRLGVGVAGTVLHGGATPSYGQVVETDFGFTNVGTANADNTKHGLLQKLSGVAGQYLDGSGAWSTPAGVTSAYTSQAYNFPAGGASHIIHNFGAYPVINVLDAAGNLLAIPSGTITVQHNTVNDLTVTFVGAAQGTIILTLGSPQAQAFVSKAVDYNVQLTDHTIEVTVAGKTMSLPTAVGQAGREFVIDNSSPDTVFVACIVGGQTIEGEATQPVPPNSAIRVYSTGAVYRID
jgi:hypothetical protein